MKTILVTGFEPFGQYATNPSWVCATALEDEINDVRIIKHELPVEFDRCMQVLEGLLEAYAPDAVLSLGVAGGSSHLEIECAGFNIQDSSMPDNAGNIRHNVPIKADGWDGYFTTLPHQAIKTTLEEVDIPVAYSLNPGFYVCNTAIYVAQYHAHTDMPEMLSGFIHLPLMDGQTDNMFTMPSEKLKYGVHLVVEVIASYLK